jgi:glutaredoxin 3
MTSRTTTKMTNVVVWSKPNCPECNKAISILTSYNIAYEVRKIGEGWTREQLLEVAPEARSVPQVFIYNNLIGGAGALEKYIEETGFNGSGHSLGN